MHHFIHRYQVNKYQENFKNKCTSSTGQENGHFDAEIAPVTVKTKKGPAEMTVDEHPKPQANIEGLAKLPSVFKKNGTVTAGSASVSGKVFCSSTEEMCLSLILSCKYLGDFELCLYCVFHITALPIKFNFCKCSSGHL